MVLLSRLLHNVDEYYKQAMLVSKAQTKWTMPDDPEPEEGDDEEMKNPPYFDDLMDISHRVDDPGLAQQLAVLAELYKRSIQIGGGYATIATAINNLKNEYSDDSESDIEGILNGMVKELAKYAGGVAALAGKDNPRFVQQLMQLRQDILLRDQDKQSEALDAYQEEVSVPGAAGEGESDLTESGLGAEEGEVVFDPTAGLGGGKDGPAVNRGWHTTGKAGAYKNWAEYYNNEKEAYEADKAQEKNPGTANIFQQLISLLGQLSLKTGEALKLSDQLKVAPDPAGQAKLDAMREDLGKLKKARTMLKGKIRSTQLNKEQQKLQAEVAGTRDEKAKELLKQKIALNELSQSSDVYKAKERNYRMALIDSMSGENYPGLETFRDFLRKIDEAKKLRKTVETYRKEQADRIKAHFEAGEAGKRTRGKPKDFKGLVTDLQQKIATQKIVVKQSITDKINAQEHTIFQPYLNAIATAKSSGNAVAIKAAAKELQKAMNTYADTQPTVQAYVAAAADFYIFRDRVKLIGDSGIMAGTVPITEDIKRQIQMVMQEGLSLINTYSGRQFFKTVVAAVIELNKALHERIR